jgi:hypothetical protein
MHGLDCAFRSKELGGKVAVMLIALWYPGVLYDSGRSAGGFRNAPWQCTIFHWRCKWEWTAMPPTPAYSQDGTLLKSAISAAPADGLQG